MTDNSISYIGRIFRSQSPLSVCLSRQKNMLWHSELNSGENNIEKKP
jgi:hypothetical protein